MSGEILPAIDILQRREDLLTGIYLLLEKSLKVEKGGRSQVVFEVCQPAGI